MKGRVRSEERCDHAVVSDPVSCPVPDARVESETAGHRSHMGAWDHAGVLLRPDVWLQAGRLRCFFTPRRCRRGRQQGDPGRRRRQQDLSLVNLPHLSKPSSVDRSARQEMRSLRIKGGLRFERNYWRLTTPCMVRARTFAPSTRPFTAGRDRRLHSAKLTTGDVGPRQRPDGRDLVPGP